MKDKPRCTEGVWGSGDRWSKYQCSHAAKHDPDKNGMPTKCGIHSAAAKANRDAKREQSMQAWRDQRTRDYAIGEAKEKIIPALRQIAAGHNDPRGLATEVLAALDAASGGRHDDGEI